ncbi:sporulation integral membrane protein YtvI [Clostridium tyrobutyricum]|uniref:sporulation integral membrane protein YtvI n=1 Tax=Clostridium tyrobutyricum TaxID=1519 RepID=UPI00057DD088|nr:sporulation integral membrane protein YtvI [Clostridium tyrobutyricum]
MDSLIEKVNKLILFFIIYTGAFIIFFGTLHYTLPFVLALICALILKRPTVYISKKLNIKPSVASLITTIIFFAIIIIGLVFGIVHLTQETIQFGKNTQTYISQNSNNILNSFYKLQKYYNNLDPNIINAINKNFTSSITKLSNVAVSISGKFVSYIINLVATIPYILMVILFTLLSTYFFTKDMLTVKNKLITILPENKANKLFSIYTETKKMLLTYIISYMIIISITFVETLVVFMIFKIKYALILSLVCAIADLLPILGIGTIYIPLALIYFFIFKNYLVALGLVIAYVVVSIIRQIIEPKLVSSSLGLNPVAVLASLFIGLKAYGIIGVLFCIFLVMFYNILKKSEIL